MQLQPWGAGAMIQPCAGALAFIRAAPRRAPRDKGAAGRLVGRLHAWGLAPPGETASVGEVLGAQLACHTLLGEPRRALALARARGFAVWQVRRPSAGMHWADGAFAGTRARPHPHGSPALCACMKPCAGRRPRVTSLPKPLCEPRA